MMQLNTSNMNSKMKKLGRRSQIMMVVPIIMLVSTAVVLPAVGFLAYQLWSNNQLLSGQKADLSRQLEQEKTALRGANSRINELINSMQKLEQEQTTLRDANS